MKQTVFDWQEVKHGFETQERLQLRLSRPGAVYIEQEGYEILLGFGSTFDAKISGRFKVNLEIEEGARAFVKARTVDQIECTGEVFTNIDRQSHESGAVLEVRRAIREMQLMQMQFRRENQEAVKLQRAEKAHSAASIKKAAGKPAEPQEAVKPDAAGGDTPESE